MNLLKKLALPGFAALLLWGFLLSLPHPQINVRWQMPGELALAANPGANGNGGNGIQGIGTSQSSGDPGGSLCLDGATSTLVSLCSVISENVSLASSAIFIVGGSGSPAFEAEGSGAIEFSCGNASGAQNCTIASFNSTAPGMVFSEQATSGMNTTNVNFRWFGNNNANNLMELAGNGNLALDTGNFAASSVSAGFGEVLTGNAAKETVGAGHVVVGSSGTLIQGTTQACSGSPANPTLFTMVEGMTCLATPGDAGSATSMVISFPYTFTNAPACFVTPAEASVASFDCATTTSAATVTLAAGGGIPIADKFWIHIVGNGP